MPPCHASLATAGMPAGIPVGGGRPVAKDGRLVIISANIYNIWGQLVMIFAEVLPQLMDEFYRSSRSSSICIYILFDTPY